MLVNNSIDNTKTVYLLDATYFCYRSFYAIKNLSTSSGFPTNAIYGFVSTLRKILEQFKPIFMGVCFDVSRQTFRTEKFVDYKMQRPPLDEDLKVQIPQIKEIVSAYGLALCQMEGFEADDLIATLVRQSKSRGFYTVIISNDKDLLQLVEDKKVVVYNPIKEIFIDEAKVQDILGVTPKQVVDFLSLAGDASDNIPGAKGIGPKTAANLINEFKDIGNIFSNISDMKQSKVKENLINSKDNIYISRDLITLKDDVDLGFSVEDIKIRNKSQELLNDLFRKFEFRKFMTETTDQVSLNSQQVNNIDNQVLFDINESGKLFFSIEDGFIYVLSKGACYKGSLLEFNFLLADEKLEKISWDIKENMLFLNDKKIDFKGKYFDATLAAYVLRSDLIDYNPVNIIWSFLKKNIDNSITSQLIYLEKVYTFLKDEILKDKLEFVFYDMEIPLLKVLEVMQTQPVRIDVVYLEDMKKEITVLKADLEKKIYSQAGEEFNLNSPKQLSEILFGRLNLRMVKKTKTGFSTNEETLRKLVNEHKIIDFILEYRKISKLLNTYLEPFISLAQESRTIYPKFHQVSTQTGRLASSSPNFQNIPSKDILGRKIRGAFRSNYEKGSLLSADYSQIELRILAHLSEDNNLIEAFAKGRDIHKFTASLLFDKSEKEVSDQERSLAKRINFGIVYGMSAHGLAKELDISFKEADLFIKEYFVRYPKVRDFFDSTQELVKKHKYVCTLFGRRRYIENIDNKNKNIYEMSLRQAINAPVQGSAADIIKLAMVDIFKKLQEANLKTRMLLQVHDELVFDVFPTEEKAVFKLVKDSMEEVVSLSVPLEVTLKTGLDWFNMKEIFI